MTGFLFDVTNAVGVVACVVGLTSFLHPNPTRFRLQISLGSCLWGIHFGMLGSQSTMLTQFVIGARSGLSVLARTPRQRHLLFAVSCAALVILVSYGWDGWVSLLPLAAAINSTAALIFAENRAMRIRMLGSSALWICTGLYWHSWPMVLAELIAVSLNLRTILRLR